MSLAAQFISLVAQSPFWLQLFFLLSDFPCGRFTVSTRTSASIVLQRHALATAPLSCFISVIVSLDTECLLIYIQACIFSSAHWIGRKRGQHMGLSVNQVASPLKGDPNNSWSAWDWSLQQHWQTEALRMGCRLCNTFCIAYTLCSAKDFTLWINCCWLNQVIPILLL